MTSNHKHQRRARRSKKSYSLVEVYNDYIEEHDYVEYERYKTIVQAFYELINKALLEDSKCVKLPAGLGYVCIVKTKPKNYSRCHTDYAASKKYGKKIVHLNEHSGGYYYRLFWSKVPYTFSARYMYQLGFLRAVKRHLAQLIFNGKDYININDLQIYKM